MKTALNLVFQYNSTNLHPDLVQSREISQEDKKRQKDKTFKDPSARAKSERLLREFDTICDREEAEK
jgi:hypothetical protein